MDRMIFGRILTNTCRVVLPALLLSSAAAHGELFHWSNEFVFMGSSAEDAAIPTFWGITWGGAVPQNENEDRLFSLASVKKMITAATSLRELGSDFRFSSEFTGEEDPDHAILFSPAFSVSGDPTWAHPSFDENLFTRISKVVAELKLRKVKRVSGEIQVNILGSAIGQHRRPEQWKSEWLLECFASLPSTVTLYGNCAEMRINSVKNAVWNTFGVSTPIENRLTAATKNSVVVTPVLDTLGRVEKYQISGGFSEAVSMAIPVTNNEEWLKNIFIYQLKSAGISYDTDPEKWEKSSRLNPVYVDLSSKPLKEILPPFLQESINIVGDRLHVEAPGDLITLASLILDPAEYRDVVLLDGSGLIAANRMSPLTFYRVLDALKSQPYFEDFYDALPVSGTSGTLQGRMTGALLKGKVHAKTGTLDHVVNLAGYWNKSDGSLEPFVIFTESDMTVQSAREKIDLKVAEFARKN